MGDATSLRISNDLALPLDVAVESLGILGTKGSGKSSTAAVLCEELWDANVQFVVLDPTGVFWGLRASRDGKGEGIPIVILGGPHGDAPLEPTAGALIADVLVDTSQSLVLDLSDFPSKAAQTRFATDLAERLYRRKARARSPLHIILDEAEEFIPQDVRGDGARMVGAWETIVALGRSRGLGETLISRRVQAVNKKVLDLIETLLAMRTGAPLARKRIEEWIEAREVEDDAGVVSTLKSLPTGTAWYWSPVRAELVEVAIRPIRTFDSYATPKPGEKRTEPRILAAIDVAALGEQIAATVEETKANDPAELRRRLAAAEKICRDQAEEIDRNREIEERAAEVVEILVFPEPLKDAIRSMVEGVAATVASAKEQIDDAVVRAKEQLDADFGLALEIVESSGREKEPARASSALRQADAVQRVPSKPARSPAAPRPETNGHTPAAIGTSAQKILETIARHHPVRLTPGQVATLSGRKPRGGSWNTAIAELRRSGYLDDDGSTYGATPDGLDVAGVSSTGLTLADWRDALPVTSRELLDLLVDARRPLDPIELAELAGRQPRGGSWNTALATLVRNGLVIREGGNLRLAEAVNG